VVGPEQAYELVRASGCRTAKVKVADPRVSLADDCARVEAVRAALGPDGAIRVDANTAWDVDTAVRAITDLDKAAGGLEYAEQPCPSIEELAAVRRRVGVRIAADESIRRAEDPLKVAVAGAADIAVLKVSPLGGVRRALEVAEACGLPCVVSSAAPRRAGCRAWCRRRWRRAWAWRRDWRWRARCRRWTSLVDWARFRCWKAMLPRIHCLLWTDTCRFRGAHRSPRTHTRRHPRSRRRGKRG
jgi:hypothetical protein